jgi:hypothetical protein
MLIVTFSLSVILQFIVSVAFSLKVLWFYSTIPRYES